MNVLKWELRKRIYQLRWIVLSFIILIGIIYLVPMPADGMSTLLLILLFLVAVGSVYIVFVYPTLSTVTDLRRKYFLLEKMRSQPFIIVAITKTILNVISVLIGSGLFLLTAEIMKIKYHISDTEFVMLNITIPYEKILYGNLLFIAAIFLPITVLFSYIAASSIPIFKRHSHLAKAILLFSIIGGAIILVAVANSPNTIVSIVKCIVVLLSFVVSCWLYDNKYGIAN